MKPVPLPLKNTVSAYLTIFRPEIQGTHRLNYIRSAGGAKNREHFEKFLQTCQTNRLQPVNVLRVYRLHGKLPLWPNQLNTGKLWQEFFRASESRGGPQQAVALEKQSLFTAIKIAVDNSLAAMVNFRHGRRCETEADTILGCLPMVEPDYLALRRVGLELVKSGQLPAPVCSAVRQALNRARTTGRIVELVRYAEQKAKEVFDATH